MAGSFWYRLQPRGSTRWVLTMLGMIFMLLIVMGGAGVVAIGPDGRDRVVVIVPTLSDMQEKYKTIQEHLVETGYAVTVKALDAPDTAEILLMQDGEYVFDTAVSLVPRAQNLGPGWSAGAVLDFVDQGGSVFVAADYNYGAFTKQLAAGLGVQLDDKLNVVIDHGSFDAGLDQDGSHSFIKAGGVTKAKPIVNAGSPSASSILFKGVGASLYTSNELVEPVLWGSPSAYCGRKFESATDIPLASGNEVVLGAVLQARNTGTGRGAYIGGVAMLQDQVMQLAGVKHRDFYLDLLSWTCGERGVLKAENVRHWLANNGEQRGTYKVQDDIGFALDVFEWAGALGHWIPTTPEDMQVEFTMLNPYIRARLVPLVSESSGESASMHANLTIPDVIGIYKFEIAYVRTGYSHVALMENVNVRPFWHNEYERFIPQAYPYYASAFVMMGSLIVFTAVVLYGKPTVDAERQHKAKDAR
ncbi:Dolichyl-diphosphooligosaccharide--protein glycosyltransferase 48 kDa subunit [Porphyridium purpureum]|uniref:Dolichyl-diphosphooligosaccharide--protein glycosyltransferase 48 kDa subunit n=1 Tax=Porphyridium purpureum TaxID=35688 RepID=A0A5J4YVH5_PORPP|nr:Dolichyl-diphosphooligosaccharide--protein glycosyltransferase 48 kDa subunit [Porphyridium purpureum]|eukprot:POR2773..scf209_3